jgi:DNA-binding NtrC family response regulator/pSer/pThr/pTyr-binding forkhead associated (FHA) protein
MAELVFFRRGEEVLRFTLANARNVLGRGENCDVVIPDPEVSRQHVALTLDGEVCTLEDLSGKGTVVSGKKETRLTLPDGADLALGQLRAVFRARGQVERDTTQVGDKTELAPKTEQRVMAAQVRVRHGHNEKVHKLAAESFTVGKDAGNDLVLNDKFISGRHLKVTRADAGFLLQDRQSTNGTWIGNARIYEVEVPLFTMLRVGEIELVLEPQGGDIRSGVYQGIIGNDPSVRQLAELIERVAPSTAAVAIFGESGTGKELVARAVHNRSSRHEHAFIPVNCAAISKELIESELFGHEKGAFTGAQNARKGAFEEADGGTLFLDEIGELPLDLQAKLLRALESGEIKRVGASKPQMVDVRIVAATNRDLLAATKQGAFREDLYYRLCVIPLHLPPLRSRMSDLANLADHFLKQFSPKAQQVRLTPSAVQKLEAHAWPGNIRELRNVIHRSLLLRKGAMIDSTDLSFDVPSVEDRDIPLPEFAPGTPLTQMLESVEKRIVELYLKRFKGNRERVAKELGVARSTLFKRLKDWGLTGSQDE